MSSKNFLTLTIHSDLKLHQAHKLLMKACFLDLTQTEATAHGNFPENLSTYDPFKERVVQALAKGLTDASIDH